MYYPKKITLEALENHFKNHLGISAGNILIFNKDTQIDCGPSLQNTKLKKGDTMVFLESFDMINASTCGWEGITFFALFNGEYINILVSNFAPYCKGNFTVWEPGFNKC